MFPSVCFTIRGSVHLPSCFDFSTEQRTESERYRRAVNVTCCLPVVSVRTAKLTLANLPVINDVLSPQLSTDTAVRLGLIKRRKQRNGCWQ